MSRRDTEIWSRHDAERARLLKQTEWPSWCYAPVAAAAAAVDNRMPVATVLSALAAWRMTKGIYRFDATLMAELLRTPLHESTPVEVLLHLPDWCVYVELHDQPTQRGPASGVWACVEWDGMHPVLGLVFDLPKDSGRAQPLSHCISLSGESVLASLEAAFSASPTMSETVVAEVAPVLSLLLYMCSSTAEITRAGLPKEHKLPWSGRGEGREAPLEPAAAPLIWNIGLSLGEHLRAARTHKAAHARYPGRDAAPKLHAARWHTSGSGKGPHQEKGPRELRWIPPAPVDRRVPVQDA